MNDDAPFRGRSDRTRADTARSAQVMSEIEAVYASRFAAFHRVASAIMGDAEQGRDAVQEGFARAIRRHRDFRGDGSLEGWLWRTVVNAAKDQRRARRAVASADQIPEPVDPSSGEPHGEEGEIRALIAGLPERQRIALFLRYYVDLSYAEIGDALQIRVGTVSATLSAAHRALRKACPPPAGRAAAGVNTMAA